MGLFSGTKRITKTPQPPPRPSNAAADAGMVRISMAEQSRVSRRPDAGGAAHVDVPAAMPSREEINRLMEEMLDAQGYKEAARQNIMMIPDDKKWVMLQGYLNTRQDPDAPDPQEWVRKVHVEPTADNLEQLAVVLRGQPRSWTEEFVLCDGVSAICDLLELYSMKPRKSDTDLAVMERLLRCVRAVMNVELGMEAIVGGETARRLAKAIQRKLDGDISDVEDYDSDEDAAASANSAPGGVVDPGRGGLRQLALLVDPKPASRESIAACKAQSDALLLLSAAAQYSSEAHARVLAAFDHLSTMRKRGKVRFAELLTSCTPSGLDKSEPRLLAAQCAVVAGSLGVLNALVSSPGQLSVRMELRTELKLAGLDDVFSEVADSAVDEALVHVRTYEQDAEGDECEATGKPRPVTDKAAAAGAPAAAPAGAPAAAPGGGATLAAATPEQAPLVDIFQTLTAKVGAPSPALIAALQAVVDASDQPDRLEAAAQAAKGLERKPSILQRAASAAKGMVAGGKSAEITVDLSATAPPPPPPAPPGGGLAPPHCQAAAPPLRRRPLPAVGSRRPPLPGGGAAPPPPPPPSLAVGSRRRHARRRRAPSSAASHPAVRRPAPRRCPPPPPIPGGAPPPPIPGGAPPPPPIPGGAPPPPGAGRRAASAADAGRRAASAAGTGHGRASGARRPGVQEEGASQAQEAAA